MRHTHYPTGANVGIALNEINEPLVSMIYQTPEGDEHEMVLTLTELDAILGMGGEALIRGRTLLEMLTTFPDMKDQILANLMFRWTGSIDGA